MLRDRRGTRRAGRRAVPAHPARHDRVPRPRRGAGRRVRATFALVARVAPAEKVGGVTGVVGAAAGSAGRPTAGDGRPLRRDGGLRHRAAAAPLVALAAAAYTWLVLRRESRTTRERTAVTRSHHTRNGTSTGSPDSDVTETLLRTRRFLQPAAVSADLRTLHQIGGRDADTFYRDRWSHDKVVRSTHGVNCTGSCSWKVYVKDGIITWEAQQTDYPSRGRTGPSTSPAAARAAPRSPGTPTPPPACATPTSRARCCRCTERRRPGTATRWRPGLDRGEPRAGAALQVPARARRPRARLLGGGRRDGRRRRTCTPSSGTGRTGSRASPPSRRCRWSATPPAPGSSR